MTTNQTQQPATVCAICGGIIESPRPGRTVCFGCHLEGLVPAWYEEAEDYVYKSEYGHSNALCTPPTGIDLLDCPSGQHQIEYLARSLFSEREMFRMGQAEARLGIKHDCF